MCKRRELSVLIIGEAENEDDDDNEYFKVEDEVRTEHLTPPVSVSLNSIVEIDNPKTMKVVGKINGEWVVVMVGNIARNWGTTRFASKHDGGVCGHFGNRRNESR